MAVLVVLAFGVGLAGVVGVVQRSRAVEAVHSRSGSLTVTAEELYRALSDADASAASAFLSNGVEPPALRQQYEADVASAARALAAAGAASDTTTTNNYVLRIAADFPVYTGLIEAARANNRQGFPVGAAYLRVASGLMRDRLLPAAKSLYSIATGRLAADRAGAASFPWVAVPLGLLAIYGLLRVHRYVARRTRRMVNPGMAVGALAIVVALVWVAASWAAGTARLDAAARNGSDQVRQLSLARTTALEARADESLTLVARGSGGSYETSFTTLTRQLIGDDGKGGVLHSASVHATDPRVRAAVDDAAAQARDWRSVHRTLRGLDDGGRYPQAVALAVGSDPHSSAATYGRLDASLARALAITDATFDREVAGAARTSTGEVAGLVLLTLLAAAGIVAGLQQRIAEYR